jgi:two-component system, cell cycle sensor histidine kinase and response regulator CckA
MTPVQEPHTDGPSVIEAKIALAQDVLNLSNENIQLTMGLLLVDADELVSLLARLGANRARISILVQKIREQVESDKERELLDASSVRWSASRNEQPLYRLIDEQKDAEIGTTIANLMLPLLIDNNSWRAFVQFLQTQLFTQRDEEQKQKTSRRTRDFIRANQKLKSTVAEGKRIEEQLSQLGSIIESSSDAIIIHTLDGMIVGWNRGAEGVYGYSAREVLGRPRSLLVPPDQQDELPRIMDILRRGERIQVFETVHVRKDGQPIDVSITISPVKDASGKMVGTAAIARDISDRKKAEERFYKAFNASPEPITITTLSEDRFIDVNESFLRVTGFRRDQVIGRTSMDVRFWETPEDRARLIQTLHKQGSVRDLEITFRTQAGEERTGLHSAEIIEVSREKCIIAIFRDMTEQKVLEKQLRQAQKMEAIGQLSGGIAHDFNNLLSVIIGHSEVLEAKLAPCDSTLKSVEEIKKAGRHAASLVRQLLAFSRQQVLEPKVLDLNSVITDVGKMLLRLIGEDIELGIALDPQLGRIKADQGQIQQVIINLVVNARDAMPNGGKLMIKTSNVEVDENYARRNLPRVPGPYTLLEISDTGIGMDSEVQAHMFEPFFTTKEIGKGTGLGLSTVYGVVKQSGGYIWADSEPGRGTTFRIYLPRTAEAPLSNKPAPELAESLSGTETILVVEDADPVRELVRNLLLESGYTVLEAKCPDEAIRLTQQHSFPIHLLLSDVIMPSMNGPALAEALTHTRPGMKVVYMSGYTSFMDKGLIASDATVLSKPFTRDALLRKLREVLALRTVSTPV